MLRLAFTRLSPQLIDELVNLLVGQADVVVRAAGHGGRVRATSQPVLFAETEQAVGRGLARLDAQSLLQVAQDIVTAAQGAAEIGAHM